MLYSEAASCMISRIRLLNLRVLYLCAESLECSSTTCRRKAAEYIRAKAVYEFFLEEDGEGTKTQALAQAVAEAYMYLKSEHIKWQKTNSLRSPRALRVMFTRSASRGGVSNEE